MSGTDEEGGGVEEAGGAVEEEGGAVPDITTVAAWRTVFVIYVVDVKNVVRTPASEGSARVSGEERSTTSAPSRGFERRIASALVVLRERRWRLWGVVCYVTRPLRRRPDAADVNSSDVNGDLSMRR